MLLGCTGVADFTEVAARVWVARYEWFDANVTVVGGDRGVLVVDTHGNEAFADAWGGVPFTAHEDAADELARRGEEIRQRYADAPDDPHSANVVATSVVVPDDTFSRAKVLDLGDRAVELVHPGPGHTAGDLVVRVPDA